MKVLKAAVSGTMESSDIMVTVAPNEGGGLAIDLNSTVEKQFGAAIRAAIAETLEQLGIRDARVTAVDKGALDCVIRARVKASAFRACEREDYVWEVRT
ncbi:MAG: citrate lyase acyl carrier protein [Oscillibacter sp.]|jgi:citrate lyase subunit gamma (acyl carrier protein)|nr:citrate lyase acyl carrier protein [Oscillibacter sp.]